jgi:hypothetical protein
LKSISECGRGSPAMADIENSGERDAHARIWDLGEYPLVGKKLWNLSLCSVIKIGEFTKKITMEGL